MPGIIVTGHIHFATGMKSAREAIPGEKQFIKYIDFTEGSSRKELEKVLLEACAKVDKGGGILFCTDVASGTPFQVSAQICTDRKPSAVLTGSNISIITDAVMERDSFKSASDQAGHVTEVDKLAIQSILF